MRKVVLAKMSCECGYCQGYVGKTVDFSDLTKASGEVSGVLYFYKDKAGTSIPIKQVKDVNILNS